MAGMTMAAANALLKNIYLGPINNQLKTKSVIMDRWKKTARWITQDGLQVVFAMTSGWPRGQGTRPDGAPLPPAGQSIERQCLIPVVTNYSRIQSTGKAMRASQSNKGAFASVWSNEKKNQMLSFIRDENRMCCRGNGVGTIAAVSANITGGATTTITVDSTVDIQQGDRLEIWTNPGPGTGTYGELVVVATVPTSTTFTVATAVINSYTASAVIMLIREGSKDSEPYGETAIVDNGSNLITFQNLSRTVEPWLQAYVDDPGTPTALTLADMRSAKTYAEKADAFPIIHCTYELRDAYLALCQQQNFSFNTMDFDRGFHRKAISFDGLPIFPDDQLPVGYMNFTDESQMTVHQQAEIQWGNYAGTEMIPVSGFDAVEAVLLHDFAFGATRCNTSYSLRNRVAPSA